MSEPNPVVNAPPIVPGPVARARSGTTWPMVIGIVATVFGVLGVLYGLLGGFGLVMQGLFADAFAPGGAGAAGDDDWSAYRAAMQRALPWQVAMMFGGLLLATWLAIAGAGLLGRRRWAARTIVTWAWVKILYAVGVTITGMFIQQATMAALGDVDAGVAAGGAAISFTRFGGTFIALQAVLTLLWLAALPVFVLIWFRRASVHAEVAMWRASGERGSGQS